jgi:hypothetical protein
MPPRWMMDPDFEENGFEYFNEEEDEYFSNYYMHNCNDPFTYSYDSYISNVLYYIDGSNKEISDIEEEEDDE